MLRRDEQVLHYWRTHDGRGVLTNQRLFLLGHPSPIHRRILWGLELESLTELAVVEASFPQAYRMVTRIAGGPRGGAPPSAFAEPVNYDALFLVRANQATVFAGYSDRAAQIQRWIDESRVARMVATRRCVVPPRRIRS